MAYINVDIDLDEIRTWELIDELENRYLDAGDQKKLVDLLKGEEKEKLKLFYKVIDRFSLSELEEMFKENYTSTPAPKEQLQLFPAQ